MSTNSRDRNSTVLEAVAEQLRSEAARQRMSLRELSRRSGIPYPTVQKSLAGRRMIDVSELARLCMALEILPSVLWAAIAPPSEEDVGTPPGANSVSA